MQFDTAFSEKQYDDVYPPGIEHHWWNVARNGMVSDLIHMAERRNFTPLSCMLEVGCGRGHTVEHLRESGYDCYGVELASICVDERLRAHVLTGQDCLALPHEFRNKIELILLLDVIEHINDVAAFVGNVRDAYPNCRWLIVSVPARMELWSSFDQLYGHFRRYDLQTLREELMRAGANIIKSNYHFKMLYPLLYVLVRWGKGRPSANRTPFLTPLHRLFGALIRRESWVVPDFVYGTSIVGLAEFPGRDGATHPT